MTVLVIALNYLYRQARKPVLVLLVSAAPLVLAGLEFAALRRTPPPVTLGPARILLVDEDRTAASRAWRERLVAAFRPADAQVVEGRPEDVTNIARLFDAGTADALVKIPSGLDRDWRSGKRPKIEFYGNPKVDWASDVALAGIRTANLEAAMGTPLSPVTANATRPPPGPPVVEQKPGLLATILPGLCLFGALFTGQALVGILIQDRLRGASRRILVAGVSAASANLGILLYLCAGLCLPLVAIFFLPRSWSGVFAVAFLCFGFVLFSAALQLSVAATSATSRGAQAASSAINILLCLAGGAFIPIDSYPLLLKWFAGLLPNGAAQEGILAVIAPGAHTPLLTPQSITVWCWAFVLLFVAMTLGQRKVLAEQ